MLSPLPRRSVWAYCFAHFTQPYQPSPKGSSGRPAHRPFRGLLGVHSRYGLHTRAVTVFRDTLSEGFSHFVTSMTAPVLPAGAFAGWDSHPLESAAFARRTPIPDIRRAKKQSYQFSWSVPSQPGVGPAVWLRQKL